MTVEEIKRLYNIACTIKGAEEIIEEILNGTSSIMAMLHYLELHDLKDKITKEVIEAAKNRIAELKKEIEQAGDYSDCKERVTEESIIFQKNNK